MSNAAVCPMLKKYGVRCYDNVYLDGEAVIVNDWPQAKICTEKCTRQECWECEHNRKDRVHA